MTKDLEQATTELARAYAGAVAVLKVRPRNLVEFWLFDPETRGNLLASARKAGFSEHTAQKDFYQAIPTGNEDPESAGVSAITRAIIYGLRLKAIATERAEIARAAQRVKLGINPDWVLVRLKEIAVRCMGKKWDPETNDEVHGSRFNRKLFKPGSAQRALDLIGKDMGMFIDRGEAVKKSYDQMDAAQLDAEILQLEEREAELAALRASEGARVIEHAPQPPESPKPEKRASGHRKRS